MRNMAKRATIAALVAGVTIPAFSAAAASAATDATKHPQSHATHASVEPHQPIIVNMAGRPLDMTITTGDGTRLHSIVEPGRGWYPEADYSGRDTILVRDSEGVAFTGNFTYDAGWIAGTMTSTPRLRYTWHTGPFGGFDFR